MSSRERKTEPFIVGGTSGVDRLHSFDGGWLVSGGQSEAEDLGYGVGDSTLEREGAVREKTWFAPVEDSGCKDGVCPVPWASSQDFFFTTSEDLVNHPSHYTDGGIECIEAIEAQLTPEEFRGYIKGNIAKYVWREKHKGKTESLKKAKWYLDHLIEFDESQNG